MAKFDDSLRGYAYEIMRRDGFRCRYCGLDGAESFSNWLQLTEDHLLPRGHPLRDDPEFRVCACHFCNGCDNRYFRHASTRGLVFDDQTADFLVEQRRPFVLAAREGYREFWSTNVQKVP